MSEDKLMGMSEAIKKFVHDGDTVYMAGFTHLIPFSAGHEIIRQKKRNLILVRPTPDLIYDQMIAAGCAKKLVFSWAGNPGVGSLHAFRRAVEKGYPNKIEIEEYSHFALISRLVAGAMNIPFFPLKSLIGSDLPKYNLQIKTLKCPYTGQEVCVVPPLNPDVAIIHAQRADKNGNVQVWGILGDHKEAAFAAKKVIVSVEEIVDEYVVRSDPNRTLIPDFVVHALIEESWAAHPSYAQGYYDRDNEFYIEWDTISRDENLLEKYIDEWVYSIENRFEYIKKLGVEKLVKLRPKSFYSIAINYGWY
ncbi:MAG: CoA-transferase [Candidatus Bathyarchaeota archaeon]|jgi:glutaconate CoA-transferase subunit A|nr:CoA-transferase [Candidatus Bathyarchaeota archaeon]